MKQLNRATLLLLLCLPATLHATSNQPFDVWLQGVRQEASASGISPATIEEALAAIQFDESIIRLDRKQPESTKTLQEYLHSVVPEARKEKARELYAENRQLLERVGREYGVQPEYIVALWGIESNFGERMGNFNIIEALATLAYDGRRSEFFRKELLNALRILDAGHVDLYSMEGSWAGAMGQCQFMPSSFLNFAVDYDRDGRKDIWNTQADVFASIANYLSSVGWNDTVGWGVDAQYEYEGTGNKHLQSKTLGQWKRSGALHDRLGSLEGTDDSTLLHLASVGNDVYGRLYLVSENFDHILKWNRSRYFATAVGTLADGIREDNE